MSRTLQPVLRFRRSAATGLDVVALVLMLLLALWIGLIAGAGAGRPTAVLLLLAGLVAATAVARGLARWPGLAHRLVATGIAGSIAFTWPGLLNAGGAPTGYSNANATLASLGVIASLSSAQSRTDPTARRAWGGLASFLLMCVVLTGSVAGALALGLALGLLGLSAVARSADFSVVGGFIAVFLGMVLTTAIALGGNLLGLRERVAVRGELWAAAVDLVEDAPIEGIGHGEFALRNPVSDDPDLRWAHHEYLQAAAEYGMPGFLLVTAVAGVVWARLRAASKRHPASASFGAAATTAVGLHASVDHVWHAPAVLLVLAILVVPDTTLRSDVLDDLKARRRSEHSGRRLHDARRRRAEMCVAQHKPREIER